MATCVIDTKYNTAVFTSSVFIAYTAAITSSVFIALK